MHSAQQTYTNGTSARKTEANRANAQHSTGPTSDAGKARSSQNAARHSMLSSTATLLTNPNEELEALLANYRTDYAPATAHEDFLVTELAVCDWRVKHITRIESGVMANMMQASYINTVVAEQVEPGGPPVELPELSEASRDTQTAMMGSGWLHNPNAFALLLRYQTQARRDYYKALKQLEHSRKADPQVRSRPPGRQTNSSHAPEKNETNPPPPAYDLKWDVPEFFIFDPTFLDRFSKPVNKTQKDREIDFTKVHPPRQAPTLGL